MSRKLLMAVFLIGGIGLAMAFMASSAEALAWYGFSKLCFDGQWKGGSVTNGDLTITLVDFTVRTACLNTNSSADTCQPGEGNNGDVTFTFPASADPTKQKGVIYANGCIELSIYDHHFVDDPETLDVDESVTHVHTCLPYDNPNKIEIPGSAYVPKIDTVWQLTNGKTIIAQGYQTCYWPGSVDANTCLPLDNDGTPVQFTCPIDVQFKK